MTYVLLNFHNTYMALLIFHWLWGLFCTNQGLLNKYSFILDMLSHYTTHVWTQLWKLIAGMSNSTNLSFFYYLESCLLSRMCALTRYGQLVPRNRCLQELYKKSLISVQKNFMYLSEISCSFMITWLCKFPYYRRSNDT